MADVESSSSAVQQPLSSSAINSLLLTATDILTENNAQVSIHTAGISSSGLGGASSSSLPASVLGLGASGGNNVSNSSPSSLLDTPIQQSNTDLVVAGSLLDDDDGEPPAKKHLFGQPIKFSENEEKLEHRLGGILCCAVCLDLPKTAMYQCQMGHLMCAACFTHLLADGRLRDQIATCPNCRVEISKSTASRNLAVEKAASELPSLCQYCNKEFPHKSIDRHEHFECQERPTNCKYSRIGCKWRGPNHETIEHERNCLHPKKCGYEIMSALDAHDAKIKEEKKMYNTLIELLSYEKIMFNDLQLKPYRTDEYVHKLFYETARFSAFNLQWVVKARINNSQRDPHQSSERSITFQLILKTKTSSPMVIHFFALKGPFSDMKVSTQIYKHEFNEQSTESDFYLLPLPDSGECNRLLANKGINFRLLMFLLNK